MKYPETSCLETVTFGLCHVLGMKVGERVIFPNYRKSWTYLHHPKML